MGFFLSLAAIFAPGFFFVLIFCLAVQFLVGVLSFFLWVQLSVA